MQFKSFAFILFFLFTFSIYHLSRKRYRVQNGILLAASYLFYAAWDPRFLFLLIVPTSLDYMFAIMISRGRLNLSQRLKPALTLVASFFVLVFVRYQAITVSLKGHALNVSVALDQAVNPYGWEMLAITILVIVALNIFFSLPMPADENRRRKVLVAVSITMSLSLLGFFKYFNFFTDSFAALVRMISGHEIGSHSLGIALPVGISFFTFKTISYVVDVYRGKIEPSESFMDFSVYLAFFPQLLAGPIDRAKNMLSQISKKRAALTSADVKEGIWLFAWGMFKKVTLADNLAVIVNSIFAPFDQLTAPVTVPEDGLRMLAGIYAFTVQIYGDFSGYTDMSRGLAKLLGFNTMLNFNLPYFSTTPGVFWRRWHISLSTWLRDYLYIPLGGNRCATWKMYRNTMITMVLGGLWHGASWTFVLWGTYHGILLVIYRKLGIEDHQAGYPVWKKAIHGFITFNLIAFGWLLFRAQNMTTVYIFLKSIFTSPFGSPEALEFLISIIKFSWFVLLFQVIQKRVKNLEPLFTWNWFIRLNVWIYVVLGLWVFSRVATQKFIYFAF